MHALPVAHELAHDLRDDVTDTRFRWDAAPRGAADRSRAAALELHQPVRGESGGELRETHRILVGEPAVRDGDLVEGLQLLVRAAHEARVRQGLLAVRDRSFEPLAPQLPTKCLLREVRAVLRGVLLALPLREE